MKLIILLIKMLQMKKQNMMISMLFVLTDDTKDIVKINHRRWEIEESFRIMKSEFKSRPAYLIREDRIKAHFLTRKRVRRKIYSP